MPSSAELRAARAELAGREDAKGFNADERSAKRERTPAVVGGVSFTRRRKDWDVNGDMRALMRSQEKALAAAQRIRSRVAEHEAKQAEAAAQGDDDEEERLEELIDELIDRADNLTQDAELASYRLLALLLIPPAEPPEDLDATAASGFGPDVEEEALIMAAVDWLKPRLDVEDAAALATELSGSREPDPPTTPSTANGST
jgi:hypothetical protein